MIALQIKASGIVALNSLEIEDRMVYTSWELKHLAFSVNFRHCCSSSIPNGYLKVELDYSKQERIFVPSTNEVGDTANERWVAAYK